MTRKISTLAATVAIAALGFAGVVYAQSGETKKDSSATMMHDCPMMRAAAEGPTAALMHRGTLGLTAAQVNRLESIEQRARNETLAVLTPEQRGKLAQAGAGTMAGMDRMMGMMGDSQGGMKGMAECPMMQGMMRNGMGRMRMHGDSTPMRNPRER